MRKCYGLSVFLLLAACSPKYAHFKWQSDRIEHKKQGHYKIGSEYIINGKTYKPKNYSNYTAVGVASWYGKDDHNKLTANGEIFDKYDLSAAHKTLPLPSLVRVTNLENSESLVLKVNDRGPFADERLIDLSEFAAQRLGFYEKGIALVKVEYLKKESQKIADMMLKRKNRPEIRYASYEIEDIIAEAQKNYQGDTPIPGSTPIPGMDLPASTHYKKSQAQNNEIADHNDLKTSPTKGKTSIPVFVKNGLKTSETKKAAKAHNKSNIRTLKNNSDGKRYIKKISSTKESTPLKQSIKKLQTKGGNANLKTGIAKPNAATIKPKLKKSIQKTNNKNVNSKAQNIQKTNNENANSKVQNIQKTNNENVNSKAQNIQKTNNKNVDSKAQNIQKTNNDNMNSEAKKNTKTASYEQKNSSKKKIKKKFNIKKST